MKVNIIVKSPGSDRIVPRLGRMLAQDKDDWTISEGPRSDVDINYKMLYMWEPKVDEYYNNPEFMHIPLGAWFSHYPAKGKQRAWEENAQALDLRTTCAPQYFEWLKDYGLSRLVVPPVDRDHFTIRQEGRAVRRVVGVAGFMSEQGRKAPEMVAQLAESAFGKTLRLRAAGRGWPIPEKKYGSRQMAEFYQGLQVFLCTSLREGIPATVLEALSCGVKLVMPEGVGIESLLPDDIPGIERYQVDDFGDMVAAIARALEAETSAKEIRETTASFNIQNWQRSHLWAFEDLLRATSQDEKEYE